MGFFNGLLGCIATLYNQSANRFDKMSDEELESKYGDSAGQLRNTAKAAHDFYEIVQKREENENR